MKFLIIPFILLTSLSLCQDSKHIRFAFELFRHGARTPYNHINSTSQDWFGFFWNGTKELTSVGFRQHFLIGYANRQRYITDSSLLSSSYDSQELLVLSTDSNRTLLSASAQLQGLYPPGTGPTLSVQQQENAVPPNDASSYKDEQKRLGNSSLPFRTTIIPVHSFFKGDHYIQLQDKKVCHGMFEYYAKAHSSEEVKKFLEELDRKYGKDIKEVVYPYEEKMLLKYENAYSLLDDVIACEVDGRDLGILNIGNMTRDEIISDAYKFFIMDFELQKDVRNIIGRYAMSPVFYQIKEWMKMKVELDKQGKEDYRGFDMPRFVMYSAHDTTVAAFSYFMELIGMYNELKYPSFASHANLELVRYGSNVGSEIKDSDYYIEFYFNDYYISSINYIDFMKKIDETIKTTNEIKDFCGFPNEESSTTYLIVILIVFILIDILFISGIIYVLKIKCRYTSSKKGILLE